MTVSKKQYREHGFSLVELIVVVAFISILMAIAIPNYLNFQKKAKEAESRSSLGAIRTAFFAHYAEHDNFNIGNIGTLVYTQADNTGSPWGNSSLAIGTRMEWDYNTPFSILGFNPEGTVYFNYSLSTSTLSGDSASFTAMTSADLDRNGNISHYYITESLTSIRHEGDRF